MTDINKVVLVGRLTHNLSDDDRNFSFLPSGAARATVSIAVNRSKKEGDNWVDDVSYFNVTIFGKPAENLRPYLLKGKQIVVEGHLKQDRWKDQQGNNQSRISIIADNVQLLGGKSEGGNAANGSNGYQQTQKPNNGGYSQ